MKKQICQVIALFIIELMLLLPVSFSFEISGVETTDITAGSAKVKWETDEYATGIVHFGNSTSLGYKERHTNFQFYHSVSLGGLEDETDYYYAVESMDINGTVKYDNNSGNFYTFKTADITPPEMVTGLNAEDIGLDYAGLSWDAATEQDFSHYIIYRNREEIAQTTELAYTDSNLESYTPYLYRVSAVDSSGNEGPMSDSYLAHTLRLDEYAPLISYLSANSVTDSSIVINWMTNEDSNSIVYYGFNNVSDSIRKDADFTTEHNITLTGLTKDKIYSFIASSCDPDNNCANSTSSEFIAGIDTEPPQIEAGIPLIYNQRKIDIEGSVEPYSKVKLYINDMSLPQRILGKTKTKEGSFIFYDVTLSDNNFIKIVAEDKGGNVNEETYTLEVDITSPVVDLEEIPSVLSGNNLSIKGKVDEAVLLNIYLDIGSGPLPGQVTGLSAATGNNSVELNWDENDDYDFSHYVVYRQDVGPIAITEPASYNSYTDVLVNKDESYEYRVLAVNEFGKESPDSEIVSAVISQGETGLPQPQRISDVSDTQLLPKETFNLTSGGFSRSIELGAEGTYSLKLEFLDRAGNSFVLEQDITLDTTPPEIEITSPGSGSLIYENYANQVDIEGITEPGAEVHLYIHRWPLGSLDHDFEISGIPNKIADISEANLRASCRSGLGGNTFCSTGADYSTIADNEGYFEFENVDLTAWLSFGGTINAQPVTGSAIADITGAAGSYSEESEARLIFIATDSSGIRNAEEVKYRVGTCWSGNFSWELTPLIHYQSPSTISIERLRENTEQIYFYFNYSYIGLGENAKIKPRGISLTKACSDMDVLRDKRFNISCLILPDGAGTPALNPQGTISYSSVKLNRLDDMDKWLKGDWDDFFDSVNNELTFPFKVRIEYEHEVNGKKVTEVQSTCQEVTYVLDNSLIDPRDALPDWVLYDLVEFMNESIHEINEAQKNLRQIIEYVAVGCVASFLLRLVVQVARRWATFSKEKMFLLNKAGLDFDVKTDEQKEYCEGVAKGIAKKISKKNSQEAIMASMGAVQLKYFSNSDLKKCFPSIYSLWQTEANLYSMYRYTCDRLFGHKSPARWTENKEDDRLFQIIESGKICNSDESVSGQRLLARKCRDLARTLGDSADNYGMDDICFEIGRRVETLGSGTKSGTQLCKLDPSPVDASTGLYRITCKEQGSYYTPEYVIKSNDNFYMTAKSETCSEACGLDRLSDEEQIEVSKFYGESWTPPSNQGTGSTEEYAACIPVQECRNLESKYSENTGDNKVTVSTDGFTQDCFYGGKYQISSGEKIPIPTLNDPSVIDDRDLSKRRQCCCITSVKTQPPKYYYHTDTVTYQVLVDDRDPIGPQSAFEKEDSGSSDVAIADPYTAPVAPDNLKDLPWYYRYWKERFETSGVTTKVTTATRIAVDPNPGDLVISTKQTTTHTEYNPYRYISGRDMPACFGQNYWLDSAAAEDNKKTLMLDPAKQHVSAFQCLHLSGIYNRLQILKNFMTSLSTCLITIRTTGQADSGICKEMFTQYICSMVWKIIQYFIDDCSPFSGGLDAEQSESSVAEFVTNGLKSIWGSVSDSQNELAEEYGNAQLNNLIGGSEDAIARKICLAAFGYDWEISLGDVIDASYSSPYATIVQAMTSSREYLTVDPDTQKASYEYRSSWLINPGCDLSGYSIDLSCISRTEAEKYPGINCGKVQDPAGYNCDCLGLSGEKTRRFFTSGSSLTQGTLEDTNHHSIETSEYRYDHLKFRLNLDQSIASEDKANCFPDGREDGIFYFPLKDRTIQDVLSCYVDPSQGTFICTPPIDFWTSKGVAQFEGITVKTQSEDFGEDDKIILYKGDKLSVQPLIRKLEGSPVCLVMDVEKGTVEEKQLAMLIDAAGQHNPLITIDDNVQITKERSSEAKAKDANPSINNPPADIIPAVEKSSYSKAIRGSTLKYKILSSTNTKEQKINLKFYDVNANSAIDLPSTGKSIDKISIDNAEKISISELWDPSLKSYIITKKFTNEDGDEEEVVISLLGVEYGGDYSNKINSIEYELTIPQVSSDTQRWKITMWLEQTVSNQSDCSRRSDNIISYLGEEQKKVIDDIQVRSQKSTVINKPSIDMSFSGGKLYSDDSIIAAFSVYDDQGIYEIEAWIHDSDDEIVYNEEWKEDSGKLICQDTAAKYGYSDAKSCTITLDKLDLNLKGGTYTLTVKAKDTDTNMHSVEKSLTYDVQCYGNQYYGACIEETATCKRSFIENPVFGCPKEYKCCRYGQRDDVA